MPVERAIAAYKKERLNCAQSVLRAFQEHHKISEDVIAKARHLGGGRADEGLCGALHAALQLAGDPFTKQQLRSAFVSEAGSDKCREIRRAALIPCVECVKMAAKLLDEHNKCPCVVSRLGANTDEMVIGECRGNLPGGINVAGTCSVKVNQAYIC